jgi:alkylation response protein AidB-like acyl-CoA dehydrogenase
MLHKVLPDYKEIHGAYYAFAQRCCEGMNMVAADREGYFDRAAWQKTSEMLLHGLPVSAEYGGKAYSAMQVCAAFEGFAKGCINNGLTFSVAAHAAASTIPVYLHGSEEQKKEMLPRMAKGELICANAITEPGAGSDVYKMATVAVKSGDAYTIDGHKCYITNAPVADYILLYCMTDEAKGFFGGVSAFLLPAGMEGISRGEVKNKMGLNTVHMSEIWLKDVKVPAAYMLGKEGAGAMIFNESMVWEKAIMCAMNLGQLERVYEGTLAFCKKRTLNGKTLISLTNIAHALADVKVTINAARGLVYDAAYAIDERAKDALKKASIAKCYVTENAVKCIQKMQTIYGGAGYLAENGIEREYRDIYASLLYSGTADIQRNIIIGHSN